MSVHYVPGPQASFEPTCQVLAGARVILCAADGNLFPAGKAAFEASAEVMNEFLATLGVRRVLTGEELRRAASGMTFRRTASLLAAEHGVREIDGFEEWVQREKDVVTARLAATLRPDEQVVEALRTLSRRFGLAVVSSSAECRLWCSLAATGLNILFPPDRLFSAEDSLPTPTSKPDPAIYRHACTALGIKPSEGLAVEDSAAGVRAAVAAGCPTIGNLTFVPPAERAARTAQLRRLGVLAVIESWAELAALDVEGSAKSVGPGQRLARS
jgi:HAD superfamily hydrolase (TIGR01509 family)